MRRAGSRSRSRLLTVRGRTLLACGVVLLGTGIALGFRDVSRIGVLLILLPLLSRLITRRRAPQLSVARTVLPQHLGVGESAEVDLDITNVGRRSSTLFIAQEHTDAALADSPRFVLPAMQRGRSRRVNYPVRAERRGRHVLGPIALQAQDALGMTHVDLIVQSRTEVVVRPTVSPLGGSRSGGSSLGIEGEVPHMMALNGAEDISIRAYRDGDDLRKVHWPATAHRGELMVRQEEQPARRSVTLLLDPGISSGGEVDASFEWAVSAVASIAVHLADQGFTVHLATSQTLADGVLDADQGAAQVLDSLAVLQRGDAEDLARLVHALGRATERSGALIAVLGADAARRQDADPVALAGLRRPGAGAQALLVPSGGMSPTRPDGAPSGSDRLEELLGRAGWTVVTVPPEASVPTAWQTLQMSTRAGSR